MYQRWGRHATSTQGVMCKHATRIMISYMQAATTTQGVSNYVVFFKSWVVILPVQFLMLRCMDIKIFFEWHITRAPTVPQILVPHDSSRFTKHIHIKCVLLGYVCLSFYGFSCNKSNSTWAYTGQLTEKLWYHPQRTPLVRSHNCFMIYCRPSFNCMV